MTGCKPGPEIRGAQLQQTIQSRGIAEVLGAELEEPEQVGSIRLDRGGTLTLLMRQPVQPGADQIGDLRMRPSE